jgi:hypothetical protein
VAKRAAALLNPTILAAPKAPGNKATLAMEALLDAEHDALTHKAIDLAKAGDIAALRLALSGSCHPARIDRWL